MGLKHAHGTSQYRLNYAKGLAQAILENTQRIEVLWQMSNFDQVEKELADNGIRNLIDETERIMEDYRGYLTYREDMTDSLNQLK